MRASLGSNARRKVIAGFGLDGMVTGTIGVYEQLLSTRRGGKQMSAEGTRV